MKVFIAQWRDNMAVMPRSGAAIFSLREAFYAKFLHSGITLL